MHHFTIPTPKSITPAASPLTGHPRRPSSPPASLSCVVYFPPPYPGHSLVCRPAQASSFSFAASGTGFGGGCCCPPGEGERGSVPGVKDIDVATLGNLCVDIVLDVEELPPPSLEGRKAYMDKLSASPPDKVGWL
ncbi:hypothetical protein MLD38_033079 [Melastoma candidum]|uniref:Uncharacterized protein n=1 Tax=Melastoma candidum TaxID=119954 RepID=A0ACB9M7W7_9MYRT|nr:hypothetical protein MLD38_033079 [Melastoma candidum]